MHIKSKSLPVPGAIILAGLLYLVTACTADKSYDLDNVSIDTTMTLLEDGVSVPLGSTEKISLGSLMNSAGESINDIIQTGSAGELILNYEGSTSLTEQIAQLDLAGMANIDGVSFSQDVTYHVGDFDASNFTVDGQSFDCKMTFDGVDVVDIAPQPVNADVDGLAYNAGLSDFKDVISGDDFDLGSKIGDISSEHTVLERAQLDEQAALYPTETIDIPSDILAPVTIEQTVKVEAAEIKLDEKVSSTTNVKTNADAKLVISLSLKNSCLTGGEVVPDVNLDFSSLIKVEGGSKINVKDLVLNSGNSWKASKKYPISGLSKTEFGKVITLAGNVPVSGIVNTNSPVTTKTRMGQTSGDLVLDIKVSFENFTVDSADLGIETDPFEMTDNISFGDYKDKDLPDEIADVKKITLDETKPMTLKVVPANLNILKAKDIPYTFTLTFPASMEVEGANNGKLELSGNLANGASEDKIVIKALYPTVKNGKLSIDANVAVDAKVTPKGLVINSKNIPAKEEDDLSFSVSLEGTPTIKDYLVVLQSYYQDVSFDGNIEFAAEGLGDFGSFHIIPEGNPALVINFDVPTIKGLGFKPGEGGIKIQLPDVLAFDPSGIDSSLGFNKTDNSITIRNAFPNKITMPIKQLDIKPETVNGKSLVTSGYKVTGAVAIPGTEISQDELQETFGSEFGLTVAIPEIKAASISLDEKLSFDINQQFNLTIKNLPEQLKRIDEVLLDNVYVTMDVAFDGLPSSEKSPFSVDLLLTLPKFLSPNEVPIKGVVKDGKLTASPVKLEKISGIEVNGEGSIEGSISVVGSISADGANIDLGTLKPDIKASINAALQNSNGKIGITKVTGSFSYDINEETSLALDNLPEALKEDGVVLDLANPAINLDIVSNLGIPMNATLELVPIVGGAEVTANAIVLNDVALPYSTTAEKTSSVSYCICKAASSAPAGRTFLQADISSLLKSIPDGLKVKINASVNPNVTAILEPAAAYTLDINYGFNVPLEFGPDFLYTASTELDLASAASIMAYGDFGVKGTVLNDSPLNLSVDMDLLDEAGKVIPQSKSSTIDIAGASTSDVEFYLSPSDKSRAVSKARLTVKVTAIPNRTMKESDCLQFSNLMAVIPEGITVDPMNL